MRESGEMYLENILLLAEKKSPLKAIDLAESMRFSKPSVSRALAKLKEDGYIAIDASGAIKLSPSGHALAEKILERHRLLSELLMKLGVSEACADADACRIEHVISDESFAALKRHCEGRS